MSKNPVTKMKDLTLILFSLLIWSNLYAQEFGWYRVDSKGETAITNIQFTSSTHGWAIGGNSFKNQTTLLKTTDGGIHWNQVNVSNYGVFSDLYAINNDTVFIIGYDGIVLKTENGGLTWFSVILNTQDDLSTIIFLNPNKILISGSGVQFTSSDYGNTWIIDTIATSTRFETVFFTENNIGWIAGVNWDAWQAVVYKTSDGGEHWNLICSDNYVMPHSIWALNTDTLFISSGEGFGGNLRKSTNGGIGWTNISGQNLNEYQDISFLNNSMGIATGINGAFSNTIDGGKTWVISKPLEDKNLYSCFLQNETSRFVTSDAGEIFKYGQLPKLIIDSLPQNSVFYILDTINIKWNSLNVDSIGILISYDNSNTWDTIFSSYPSNSNAFKCIIPEKIKSARFCNIKIYDILNPKSICDSLSEPFEIRHPEISITSPTNFEKWDFDSVNIVAWNSIYVDSSRVEYFDPSLESWVLIVNIKNTGFDTLQWAVDKSLREIDTLSIRISATKLPQIISDTIYCIMSDFLSSNNQKYLDVIRLYPNPCNNYICISIDNNCLNGDLFVLDSQSKIVLLRESLNRIDTQIDISDLPGGMYFIVYQKDKKLIKHKFIKLQTH
jgi:photosystem II stability/assembly factor-like uncharacterized protein